MTVATWISQMVAAITETFNQFVTGIGSGVADFFKEIFLVNTGTDAAPVYELSVFATVSLVMLGISLAIGVTTLVVHMVRRK